MTIKLLEGAVEDLSAYIQANLDAKITTINARYADGLTLLPPDKYYDGSIPLSLPNPVSIVFHGIGWTPTEQRLANVLLLNRVAIVVFVADNDVERRFKKLCRYAVCLTELLQSAKGNLAYVVKLNGAVDLTEPQATGQFLQGIIVPVSLQAMETY